MSLLPKTRLSFWSNVDQKLCNTWRINFAYKVYSLMPLLTPYQRSTLHTYQYSGGDSSPVYQYVLSPLAQFCVDTFIPLWCAPNLVTLFGLSASLLALVATLYYDAGLEGKGPRWLYLLTGFCIFAYQTFDNMDGKQARKTKSSSPLGMLFDHGCDAINAGLMPIAMAAALSCGWTTKMFMVLWSAFVPFYFQTWEEYYIGTMILPSFNGPTEGLLMAAGICIMTYFVGPDWWHQVIYHHPLLDAVIQPIRTTLGFDWMPTSGVTPFLFVFAFTVTVTGLTALKQVITVLCFVYKKGTSMVKPIVDLLPFLVFFPSVLIYAAISDIAFKQYPFVTHLCVCSTFVEMLVHMMVSHICHGEIMPFHRTGAWLTAVLPLLSYYQAGYYYTLHIETVALAVFTVYSFTRTGLMLYQMCNEVADELGIYVLRLGKRRVD